MVIGLICFLSTIRQRILLLIIFYSTQSLSDQTHKTQEKKWTDDAKLKHT